MKKKLIIVKEKVIKAEPTQIWKVITTPKYFNDWMFVPGKAVDIKPLKHGSKIHWINEQGITYLEGEVIEFIPFKKIVISLQDISWDRVYPKGTVTYEYHLSETDKGTKVKFYLGDLSIDPEGEMWFEAYDSSDEISAIERIINMEN
jgi:uncharacterized protein YndB with AHSA1/START domain